MPGLRDKPESMRAEIAVKIQVTTYGIALDNRLFGQFQKECRFTLIKLLDKLFLLPVGDGFRFGLDL